MPETKIDLLDFENPAIEQEIRAMLEDYRSLLPRWLRELRVNMCDQQGGMLLKCHYGSQEYMRCGLSVFPRWLDQSEENRRIGIIHELVHLQHAEFLAFAEDQMLEPVKERNQDLHSFLAEETRKRLERFTESIAVGIYDSLHGRPRDDG